VMAIQDLDVDGIRRDIELILAAVDKSVYHPVEIESKWEYGGTDEDRDARIAEVIEHGRCAVPSRWHLSAHEKEERRKAETPTPCPVCGEPRRGKPIAERFLKPTDDAATA